MIKCVEKGYASFCPKLDIARKGDTIEEAHKDLLGMVKLFLETASFKEIQTPLRKYM